jgi:hypothetical protein
MKKIIYFLGITSIALLLTACEKSVVGPNYSGSRESQEAAQSENAGGSLSLNGTIRVKLVNTPVQIYDVGSGESSTEKQLPGIYPRYNGVFLDLRTVWIHGEHGWTELKTESAIYDLVSMNPDDGVVIVNNVPASVGIIDQVKLVLGTENSIAIFDAQVPLLPEKIDEALTTVTLSGAAISLSKTTEIILSIDQFSSVYKPAGNDYTGDNDEFFFKPLLKVKAIHQI